MAGGIDPLFESHPEMLKRKADAKAAWETAWDNFMPRADKSDALVEARRKMRAKILALNDSELHDLYYEAVTLSEHEAARRAVNHVLERSSRSNRAEA